MHLGVLVATASILESSLLVIGRTFLSLSVHDVIRGAVSTGVTLGNGVGKRANDCWVKLLLNGALKSSGGRVS